jgi:TM2 domain-containing membrane protein YozV
MANCANHPQSTATAFCRTCGKPLCDECKRDVRGVIYCEDCIVARLQGAPAGSAFGAPPPAPAAATRGLPNPTLAAFLGFIPGVGAMYNGQFVKGIVHVLIFPALIAMTDQVEAFGILIPFYFFYMVIDAYKVAQARQRGEKPPDYLGLNSLIEQDAPSSPAAAAMAAAEPVRTGPPVPVGAVVLIGLGVLFLMANMGLIPHNFFGRGWPLILIGIGVWMAYKRIYMIR